MTPRFACIASLLLSLNGCQEPKNPEAEKIWRETSFHPSSSQEVIGRYKSSSSFSFEELELNLDGTFRERIGTDVHYLYDCVKWWKGTYTWREDMVHLVYETAEFHSQTDSSTIQQAREGLREKLETRNQEESRLYIKRVHKLDILSRIYQKDQLVEVFNRLKRIPELKRKIVSSYWVNFLVKENPDSSEVESNTR